MGRRGNFGYSTGLLADCLLRCATTGIVSYIAEYPHQAFLASVSVIMIPSFSEHFRQKSDIGTSSGLLMNMESDHPQKASGGRLD